MIKQSISCVVTSPAQAEAVIDHFEASNFASHDISVRFAAHDSSDDCARRNAIETPASVVPGAGVGGLIGGAFGWVMGLGALSFPGAGPYIVAAPFVAALGGAAVGGIAGGAVVRAVVTVEARRRGERRGSGSYILSVRTRSRDEISRVAEIFDDAGADEIWATGEADAAEANHSNQAAISC